MTEPREDQAEIRRQIELERSWVDEGIKEYEELRERRGEANLPPGIKLTMKLMEPVVEGIKELCLGTNIQQKPVRDFLLNFRPEEVAFVTVQSCINAIASGGKKQRRTNLAFQIADTLAFRQTIHRKDSDVRQQLSQFGDVVGRQCRSCVRDVTQMP